MSPLRQEALQILEATPEEELPALIRQMRALSEPLPDRAEFRRILEQKFGLKDDAAEIHEAATFITGSLAKMNVVDKCKSVEDFRDERLREKYA